MSEVKVKDEILVQQLTKGNYKAFDSLFNAYCDRLYHFVVSIVKVSQIAEDIVQEVFVTIWEKRNELDRHKSFKSFLFSIAYNETISVLRKKKTENTYIEKVQEKIAESKVLNTPDLEMEYHEIKNHVNDVIESMPERRREIFLLSRNEGLTYTEIANKLDISKNTVENQMVSALKTIREKINSKSLLSMLFYYLFLF